MRSRAIPTGATSYRRTSPGRASLSRPRWRSRGGHRCVIDGASRVGLHVDNAHDPGLAMSAAQQKVVDQSSALRPVLLALHRRRSLEVPARPVMPRVLHPSIGETVVMLRFVVMSLPSMTSTRSPMKWPSTQAGRTWSRSRPGRRHQHPLRRSTSPTGSRRTGLARSDGDYEYSLSAAIISCCTVARKRSRAPAYFASVLTRWASLCPWTSSSRSGS